MGMGMGMGMGIGITKKLLLLIFLVLGISFTMANAPELSYVAPTPDTFDILNKNYFTTAIEIIDDNISGFTYTFDGVSKTISHSGLVAMYNFDNVSALGENTGLVIDVSSNSNNGTVNGAAWTTSGKFGGAYKFDGTDDYINIGDIEMSDWSDITVSAWIKTDQDLVQRIVSKDQQGTPGNFMLRNGSTTYCNGLGFQIYDIVYGDFRSACHTNKGWINNQWHNVVGIVNNNDNKIYLYLDGILVDSDTFSASTLDDSNNEEIVIGADSDVGNNAFVWNGSIDEIKIYNRALSADEVAAIYQGNINKYDTENRIYTAYHTGLIDADYTFSSCVTDIVDNTACLANRTITINAIGDRDNDKFIDETFWDLNPSDSQIIDALFGDGDIGTDTTAYTEHWKDNCDTSIMTVEYIDSYETSGLSGVLGVHSNKIFVLEEGSHITNDKIVLTCSAVIGKGDVTIYASTGGYNIFNSSNKRIIDNVTIDGTSNGVGGTHSPSRGVYTWYNNRNFTFNNITLKKCSYGISLRHSYNVLLNNIKAYNNDYAIYFVPAFYTQITNSEFYNNSIHGLYLKGDAHNVNNIISFNNGGNGIAISSTGTINNSLSFNNGGNQVSNDGILNNVHIYNTSHKGIKLGYSSILNDVSIFNNLYYTAGSSDGAIKNVYYGYVFDADNKGYVNYSTNFNDQYLQPGTGDFSSIGWSTGVANTGSKSYHTMMVNVLNSNGDQLIPEGGKFMDIQGQLSWSADDNISYQFGSDVPQQTQPIVYSGDELVNWTDQDWDPCAYVGDFTMTNQCKIDEGYSVNGFYGDEWENMGLLPGSIHTIKLFKNNRSLDTNIVNATTTLFGNWKFGDIAPDEAKEININVKFF